MHQKGECLSGCVVSFLEETEDIEFYIHEMEQTYGGGGG